jgi:Arc/MetJ-type ribon-helix-helix transcriptional regulator
MLGSIRREIGAMRGRIANRVPGGLFGEMRSLVDSGWFRNLDEIILEALRRYVESHRAELMEDFVREDVGWGLCGDD